MLRWTITFIIIALIAGVLGFGGIAGTAAGIAKIIFVIFIILFLISLITGRKKIEVPKNRREGNGKFIKLSGAMELAPIVGLSDCIVDLVDTGNTLKANNLIPLDFIYDISSRLIVNSAAFNTKHSQINDWIKRIERNL